MASTQLDSETLAARRTAGRPFYTWGAIAALLVVFAGFARTFYLNGYLAHFPLTGMLYLHGLVMTLWFALFLVQVRLVAAGRTPVHRRVGVFGAIAAVLVLIVGTTTAILGARAGHTPPGAPPALVFLAIPIGDMVMFAGLTGAAIWLRRRPEYHKRLMLLATLGILTAAISRIPIDALQAGGLPAFFGATDVLLIACIAVDTIRNRRLHPAFAWGFGFILLTQVARFVGAGTPQWMALARWMTGS
ncbi:MAG TPA: hypothetical protein VN613_08155 [Gemmatimonadaceae bacterium]|nr:hypothetical protein [Gemmatimonadaceae bacterium]